MINLIQYYLNKYEKEVKYVTSKIEHFKEWYVQTVRAILFVLFWGTILIVLGHLIGLD